jgi:hypothetical protein
MLGLYRDEGGVRPTNLGYSRCGAAGSATVFFLKSDLYSAVTVDTRRGWQLKANERSHVTAYLRGYCMVAQT